MLKRNVRPHPWTARWYASIRTTAVAKVVLRFIAASLITVLILAIKHTLTAQWTNTTYLLLTTAVMFAAYIGGFTGGALSTVISTVYVVHFLPSGSADRQLYFNYEIQLIFFILQSLFLSWLISLLLRHNVTELRLRRWFETTLSSIGDGVIATDEAGSVVFMNEAAQRLTHWDIRDAYGQPLPKIFNIAGTQSHAKAAAYVISAVLTRRQVVNDNDIVLKTRDFFRRYVEVSAAPIKQREEVVGAIITFRDITNKKEREEALAKAGRQIREIFESITDGFYSVDSLWNITYANKKAEMLLKMPSREFINKNIWEVFPSIKGTLLEKKYRSVIRSKRSASFEYFGKRINKWLAVSVYPMKSGLAVYMSDITKRKRTELILKEQQSELLKKERQLQAIIDGTPEIVFVKDLAGRYLIINNALEEMLGMSREEVRGKTDYDLFDREHADQYRKNDMRVIGNGERFQVEEEAPMKDGYHIFIANKFPLQDTGGRIYALCGISTDITDRKILEQKKDEFMSVASHELKTPLTSVKAYVQILERIMKSSGNDQAKLIIGKTSLYINKLQTLISDLLDISKIQAGKMNLERESFDIYDLISQSVESVQLFSSFHKIRMDNVIRQKVAGDRQRLEQVVVNFLTNAIKYSPGKKEIMVSAKRIGQDVEVSVTDYGIGIPQNRQKDLFKRFYRVEDTARRFSGLGIGLFISAEIVKRHGGRIWVNSSPRKGSTFSFSLPLGSPIS